MISVVTISNSSSNSSSISICISIALLLVVVIVVVVVVVVVVIPNGLVYDLWVKHTLSKEMYNSIGKRNMFDKYLFQKQHAK